jgi:drug/metabolite transporter (DMT)-like permease
MTDKQKGIFAITMSALAFTIMAVFIKEAGDLPSFQKSLFRNIISVIFVGTLILRNNLKLSSIKNYKLLILRSTFGTVGIIANFYAVDHLALADANIINRLSIFFVIIFSFMFLGERATFKQLLAVVVAFIGALIVIRPQFNVELIPYLIAILGALCAGGAYTVLRALGKKEHPLLVVFFFSAFSTLLLLPIVIFSYQAMTWYQFGSLVLAGIFATLGQFGVTFAYKFAPASEISIYNFSGVIFSALFGFIIFGQSPELINYLGYTIIFSASLYMFMDKKKAN